MPFNDVQHDPQAERMACLIEEAGEVLQAVGKVQRHGWESQDPTQAGQLPDNRESMERELGNLVAAVLLMARAGDIDPYAVLAAAKAKLETVQEWLHCRTNVWLAKETLGLLSSDLAGEAVAALLKDGKRRRE